MFVSDIPMLNNLHRVVPTVATGCMLLNAEYRDAAVASHIRQSARSTTVTTTAVTNHWAAIQYVSGRGRPMSIVHF